MKNAKRGPNGEWRNHPVIVHSTEDLAGCNIARHLLKLGEWKKGELGGRSLWLGEGRNLLAVKDRLVDSDGLDAWFKEHGLTSSLIIFASRHSSDDGRAVLTAHHTGNPGAAELGGDPGELSRPAPGALRAAYHALLRHCPRGFTVTLEATHHGPSSLDIPSLFVEIGSGEEQWEMPEPGRAVARSIIEVADAEEARDVLVSFGGTHYAPRQNRILAETGASFGHIFANHSIPDVDEEILRRALELSGTKYAHLDRKGISAAQRDRLAGLLAKCGAVVLGENEIRRRWPSVEGFCPLKVSNPVMPGGLRAEVAAELVRALEGCACGKFGAGGTLNECPGMEEFDVDDELISLCLRLNRADTMAMISRLAVAYSVRTGEKRVFRFWKARGDDVTVRRLVDGLFSILTARGEVRFDRMTSTLTVTERKFDPARARNAGIPPGPLYSRLAAGETAEIDGRTVYAEEVLVDVTTEVRLKYFAEPAASIPGGE